MPECYSQRMLNPFHGIVNVIEIDEADAVCQDGVNWTLFVHRAESVLLEDGRCHHVGIPDIKFGVWSEHTGLKRSPIRNPADYVFVDHIGRYLLNVIKAKAAAMPFALQDDYLKFRSSNSAINLA